MKVGISIVHFGEQELLDNCVSSLDLPNKSNGDFHFSVFDCNKENLGFTMANNRLIKNFIKIHDVEWVWLLNNDTKVLPNTLEDIRKILPTIDSNVGVIGFKILSMDDPDLIHHGGTFQCFPNGIHKSGSVALNDLSERTYEKWVTFASVLIRRDVFEKIGLLDENMKFICSDSDFCYRARAAGFKIIYEPKFVVHHKIGQSSTPNPVVHKQMMQDTIYFQNKWLNGGLFNDLNSELL